MFLFLKNFYQNLRFISKDLWGKRRDFIDDLRNIVHRMRNIYDSNLDVGISHYNKKNFFDAKLRFLFILKFLKKNDEKAMQYLVLCYIQAAKIKKIKLYNFF